MRKRIFNTDKKTLLLFFLVIYFAINLLFLTKFPFIHSDEPWLSGLSRNIMEQKDYSVTETFFDLYERNPHAIKSVFHTIQIFFIKFFGYSVFSVRLISLIFGILTLIYFYKLCNKIFNKSIYSLLATLMLSLDIQFIYASHFARQEIILTFVLIFALNYLFKYLCSFNSKNAITLGLIIGVSIGIHPNSFIIALPVAFIMFYHILITKKISMKDAIICFITITLFATIYIFLSLSFDHNFFTNYSNYGQQFGVFHSPDKKISQLLNFYLKLFFGVSGTYYTPNIRFQFILFGVAFVMSIIKLFQNNSSENKSNIFSIILSIIAINIGIIIVGRYNQTCIIFLFPLLYILVLNSYICVSKKFSGIISTAILIILLLSTLGNISPFRYNHYENYLTEISTVVSKDNRVLANLNSEFYFNNDRLHDYRNLAYLKENNLTFKEYIENNGIEYIIYPEEMDFIYNSRPLWNGIYGNTYYYYEDMIDFLKNHCYLVHEFNNSIYGNRIARYINTENWNIKIYQVKKQ